MTEKSFKRAVLMAGSFANLPGKEDAAFAASVQPLNPKENSPAEPGAGYLRRYVLYAEYNPASEELKDGGLVEYADGIYRAEHVETRFIKGKAVYRRAILTLEEEKS